MIVSRQGETLTAEENGRVLGVARLVPGGGVVLELDDPREGVALALLRAAAAAARSDEGVVEDRDVSFGSVHIQTDDQGAVLQTVARLVPRVFRSHATVVSEARNGWVAVYDQVADRDPRQLARLGRELSNASGHVVFTIGVEEGKAVHYIAFERGRTLDEYLSVPDFRGPLPPGDAVALRANPTVVARLTGAEAASVRAVARTAASPDELPPADQLMAELAEVLGLEGAGIGFEAARELPGAIVVEHE
jgi:hypothetical protein